MPKISIVVLQFNQSDRTLACLESLARLSTSDVDIVVVDNASETKHLKNVEYWIEANRMTNYKLRISNENLGYSGGNNIGIKQALADGAEYVLILNNDTIVPPNILEKMMQVNADVVGVRAGIIRWLKRELEYIVSYHMINNCIYLSGEALLVHRNVFEKIGLFDERYFLYFEDVDFSIRARKAGFTLACADAKIHHETSATSRTLPTTNLFYYHTRNALLLNAAHGPWWVRLALPFWKWWIIFKQRVKIAFGRDIEISQAILQGVHDYDHHRFGMRIH